MILYFFALFVLGAMAAFFSGLLGIGGGIFYVPGLNELLMHQGILPSISMHLALGTSTTVNVFNAMINLHRHKKHQAINWTIAMTLVPSLMFGAFAGGMIAGYLPANALKISFAILLLCIGLRFTFKKHRQSTRPLPNRWFMGGAGIVIGLIASLNGLGGGVILVPFLGRYNIEMREIVAISAACILPQSLFGMMGYMISGWGNPELPAYTLGYVYWPVALPLILMSVLFVPVGVKLVHALPQTKIRKIFGLLLLAVCTYMLYDVYVRF
jgi:uncharacterized protein